MRCPVHLPLFNLFIVLEQILLWCLKLQHEKITVQEEGWGWAGGGDERGLKHGWRSVTLLLITASLAAVLSHVDNSGRTADKNTCRGYSWKNSAVFYVFIGSLYILASKALGMKLVIKAARTMWRRIFPFCVCVCVCARCCSSRSGGSLHSGVKNGKKKKKTEENEQEPNTHLHPHTYTFCLRPFLPPNPQASRCCCHPCSAEALQCGTAWSDDNKHLRHNLGLCICIFAWFNLRGKYANVCKMKSIS